MSKIGLLITKLNGGGAERTAANLSCLFTEKGHEVYLIVFDATHITYPYKGKLIDLSLGVHKNKVEVVTKNLSRVFKVRKVKKIYELDVVISFLDTPNLVNILSGVKSKKIVSIRNNLSSEKQTFFRKKMIEYTCKKADLTVSVSENVKKDLIENFNINKDKVLTIYNPIDIQQLLSVENEYNNFRHDFNEYFNIVTMGRLTYQKGQWHLIKAMKEVVKENPKTRLYILGEGELKRDLEVLVNRLDLDDNVIFLGYITNAHKFIKECDLFVFSSLFEGLGNVILEAMALGLPVISTDCKSGPREILAPNSNMDIVCNDVEYGEYGVLVAPFDKQFNINNYDENSQEIILKSAILNLTKNKDLLHHYKRQSYKRSLSFLKEHIGKKWEENF